MSQSNNKYLTTTLNSSTISSTGYSYINKIPSFNDYTISDHNEFNGDFVINGKLIINGDIYQKDDKCHMSKKETHDAEIEVVDNGFIVSIGNRKYVFGDLDTLDKWMKENFNTPEKAKKIVSDSNNMSIPQLDFLKGFEKLTNTPSSHYHHPWELDQQIRGGTIDSGSYTDPFAYGTSSGTNIKEGNVTGGTYTGWTYNGRL